MDSLLNLDPSKFSLSEEGLNFIKRKEGLKPEMYLDSAGHRTIGYGHRVLPNEIEEFRTSIDGNRALQLLARDVEWAEKAVRRSVKVPLSQQQYDALVSFTYNIGHNGFKESTALKRLNEGEYAQAADAMLMWNKTTDKNGDLVFSDGLINRRGEEWRLFMRE